MLFLPKRNPYDYSMILQFLGASRQVTGSMFLLELDDGFRVLVDCGQDLEKNPLPTEDIGFGPFPFAPADIDIVLLTHAHIDHSGRLPTLFRHGYLGDVLCTLPTYYLASLLLADSAQLMRKKAEAQQDRNRKRKQRRLGRGSDNDWGEYSARRGSKSIALRAHRIYRTLQRSSQSNRHLQPHRSPTGCCQHYFGGKEKQRNRLSHRL